MMRREWGVRNGVSGSVERAYDEADARNSARVHNARTFSTVTRYVAVSREVTDWEEISSFRKPHDSQEEQ